MHQVVREADRVVREADRGEGDSPLLVRQEPARVEPVWAWEEVLSPAQQAVRLEALVLGTKRPVEWQESC